ncbi:glycosyltransferase [Cylindrospermopsis curvispora]|uniref:Glycosyltransferase n=1 Tax=Cylindrospermopsis curvispora GIHE-G1 TaxID=2666332 RepID=A0A7H0F1N1_9CYAN|nr:glycosyltransferase [Cylindrospermopsis curvispora]QNP29947.1 glycosyltransferase [Cylindrospermopsis curvispora GIHE-G1]
MKIIHLPFCFHPDPMGGTEIYVEALARELTKQGITNIIAAPAATNQSYIYNQTPVRRFAISPQVKHLKEIYGQGDELGAMEFSKILDAEQPDLIHLHAFTRGVSLRLVRLAKSRGIPVIFTYHTPTVSCQRGTLLQWGNQVCSGQIQLSQCTACTLQGLGISSSTAQIISNLPPIVGATLTRIGLSGGIWTALQMRELVNSRTQAFQSLMLEVDHIIAVCDWVKKVLILNQVPQQKIVVIRQGLCQELLLETGEFSPLSSLVSGVPLRLVFFGRLDPTKGIDILIQAFIAHPQLNATLDIYGICQSTSGDSYQAKIQHLSRNDHRINWKTPVLPAQVVKTMKNYDLLVVPSQWLETGPMVVLEAFAAGIPVIGSNLGGIGELVEHHVNGILVEAGCIKAWGQELQFLCDNREQLGRLQSGITPPPTMEMVAQKMKLIYQKTGAKN